MHIVITSIIAKRAPPVKWLRLECDGLFQCLGMVSSAVDSNSLASSVLLHHHQAFKAQSVRTSAPELMQPRLSPAPPMASDPALRIRVSSAADHLDQTAARLKTIFSPHHHDTVTFRPSSAGAAKYTPEVNSSWSPYSPASAGKPDPSGYDRSPSLSSPPWSPISQPLNDATHIYSSYSSPAARSPLEAKPQCSSCTNLYCESNSYCLRKGAL